MIMSIPFVIICTGSALAILTSSEVIIMSYFFIPTLEAYLAGLLMTLYACSTVIITVRLTVRSSITTMKIISD